MAAAMTGTSMQNPTSKEDRHTAVHFHQLHAVLFIVLCKVYFAPIDFIIFDAIQNCTTLSNNTRPLLEIWHVWSVIIIVYRLDCITSRDNAYHRDTGSSEPF